MKRIKDSNNVTAFGESVAAEQIKRSGVLRRLAGGLGDDEPSAIAALLPQDQFLAWSQFTKEQNLSAERLAAVLEVRSRPPLSTCVAPSNNSPTTVAPFLYAPSFTASTHITSIICAHGRLLRPPRCFPCDDQPLAKRLEVIPGHDMGAHRQERAPLTSAFIT